MNLDFSVNDPSYYSGGSFHNLDDYILNSGITFKKNNRAWTWSDPLREGAAGLVQQFAPSDMETERLQSLVGLTDEQFIEAVRNGTVKQEEWPLGKMPQQRRDDLLRGQIASRLNWKENVNSVAGYIAPTPHAQPEGILENIGYQGLRMIPGAVQSAAEYYFSPLGFFLKNVLTGNQNSQENVYRNMRNQGKSPKEARDIALSPGGNLADLGLRGVADFATMYALGRPITGNPIGQTLGNIGRASLYSGAGAAGEQALTNYRSGIDNEPQDILKTGLIGAGSTAAMGLINMAFNWRNLRELQREYNRNRPIDAEFRDLGSTIIDDEPPALGMGDNHNPNDNMPPSGSSEALALPEFSEGVARNNARAENARNNFRAKWNEAITKRGFNPVFDDASHEASIQQIWNAVFNGEISPENAVALYTEAGMSQEGAQNAVNGILQLKQQHPDLLRQHDTNAPVRQPQEFSFKPDWNDPLFPRDNETQNSLPQTQKQSPIDNAYAPKQGEWVDPLRLRSTRQNPVVEHLEPDAPILPDLEITPDTNLPAPDVPIDNLLPFIMGGLKESPFDNQPPQFTPSNQPLPPYLPAIPDARKRVEEYDRPDVHSIQFGNEKLGTQSYISNINRPAVQSLDVNDPSIQPPAPNLPIDEFLPAIRNQYLPAIPPARKRVQEYEKPDTHSTIPNGGRVDVIVGGFNNTQKPNAFSVTPNGGKVDVHSGFNPISKPEAHSMSLEDGKLGTQSYSPNINKLGVHHLDVNAPAWQPPAFNAPEHEPVSDIEPDTEPDSEIDDDDGFIDQIQVDHQGRTHTLDVFADELDDGRPFIELSDYTGTPVAIYIPESDSFNLYADFSTKGWARNIEDAFRKQLPDLLKKAGINAPKDKADDLSSAPLPDNAALKDGTFNVKMGENSSTLNVQAWTNGNDRRLYIGQNNVTVGYFDANSGTFEDFNPSYGGLNRIVQQSFLNHIQDFYDAPHDNLTPFSVLDTASSPSAIPENKSEGNINAPAADNTFRPELVHEPKKSSDYSGENKNAISEAENDSTSSSNIDPYLEVAEKVKEHVLSGKSQMSNKQLFDLADNAFGGTIGEGKYNVKDAYDAMELGINMAILELGINPNSAANIQDALDDLASLIDFLSLIPTQRNRTDEQIEFQQFSTPPTLAYIVNWLANIHDNDTVLEPSAGVGGLAVFASNTGADLTLNELNTRRAMLLEELFGAGIFRENAEHINDVLSPQIEDKPDRIIMNPPFSAAAGRVSKHDTRNAAKHVEQALQLLADNGRLVTILGKGMAEDSPTFAGWWKHIKKKYNVKAVISIDGDNYKKFGTTWDNIIAVIDKDGATPDSGTFSAHFDDLNDILSNLRLQNIQIHAPDIDDDEVNRETYKNENENKNENDDESDTDDEQTQQSEKQLHVYTFKDFKRAFDELEREHIFVNIPELRKKLNWPHDVFDQMISKLRDNQIITLHVTDLTEFQPEEFFYDRELDNARIGMISWISQEERQNRGLPDIDYNHDFNITSYDDTLTMPDPHQYPAAAISFLILNDKNNFLPNPYFDIHELNETARNLGIDDDVFLDVIQNMNDAGIISLVEGDKNEEGIQLKDDPLKINYTSFTVNSKEALRSIVENSGNDVDDEATPDIEPTSLDTSTDTSPDNGSNSKLNSSNHENLKNITPELIEAKLRDMLKGIPDDKAEDIMLEALSEPDNMAKLEKFVQLTDAFKKQHKKTGRASSNTTHAVNLIDIFDREGSQALIDTLKDLDVHELKKIIRSNAMDSGGMTRSWEDAARLRKFIFDDIYRHATRGHAFLPEIEKRYSDPKYARPPEDYNFSSPHKTTPANQNEITSINEPKHEPAKITSDSSNEDEASEDIFAWHGTPHSINGFFNLDFVGTGEGHQSFGYGIYYAGAEDAARTYRRGHNNALVNIILNDGSVLDSNDELFDLIFGGTQDNYLFPDDYSQKDFVQVRNALKQRLIKSAKRLEDAPQYKDKHEKYQAAIQALDNAQSFTVFNGNLYKAKMPNKKLLLNYDASINEQSKKVRSVLEKIINRAKTWGISNRTLEYLRIAPTGGAFYVGLKEAMHEFMANRKKSGKLPKRITRDDMAASFMLNRYGIPGLFFWDRKSGKNQSRAYNFIIWNTKLIKKHSTSPDSEQDAIDAFNQENSAAEPKAASEPKSASEPRQINEPVPARKIKSSEPESTTEKPDKTVKRWNALKKIHSNEDLNKFLSRLTKAQLEEIFSVEQFNLTIPYSISKGELKANIVEKIFKEITRRYSIIDDGHEVFGNLNGEDIVLDTPLIRARKEFNAGGRIETTKPKKKRRN